MVKKDVTSRKKLFRTVESRQTFFFFICWTVVCSAAVMLTEQYFVVLVTWIGIIMGVILMKIAINWVEAGE